MSRKVVCETCSKCDGKHCLAKKGEHVELNKRRFCTKYELDEVKKQEIDVRKQQIPTYAFTYRFYDAFWADYEKQMGRGNKQNASEVAEEVSGPMLVRVK